MRLSNALFVVTLALLLVLVGAASSEQFDSRTFGLWELGVLRTVVPDDQDNHSKSSSISQQEQKELRDDLDSAIRELMARHRIPSLTVGLLDNGKVTLQKAYGHDPLYTFGQNNSSNPYLLGAVSQVLTGYGILLLKGEGRLSLSDPVSKFLPNLPEAWRSITIEELLAHRSGLPDFPPDAKSFSAAVEATAGKPVRFAPGGGRFSAYSDYDILGQVIERLTGRSYFKFMEAEVFKRLKLSLTGDPTLLLFRYAPPEDVRTTGEANLTRNMGQVASNTLSGRRTDSDARVDMIRLMTRGIPEYSIPSKGLVGNAGDMLKIAAAIGSGSLPGIPDGRGYLQLAPGWLACHAGNEVLLTAHGMAGGGFLAVVDVIPTQKTGLVLLGKLEPGSEIFDLREENEEILDKVLAFPVSEMTCAGQPTSDEDAPEN
jgi:CubicO group peptidase (beta-lactamase class C family)